MRSPATAAEFNAFGAGYLPGQAGVVIRSVDAASARVEAVMAVRRELMAPTDCLHGGAFMVLADTAAGYGALATLPVGAAGFLTLEMKSNHLGAARYGTVRCVASARHLGRSTQVWEAELTHEESGRTLALFRCTQLVLYDG
ncbi:PaaI family thioesterase [Lysobacter sp. HA18]